MFKRVYFFQISPISNSNNMDNINVDATLKLYNAIRTPPKRKFKFGLHLDKPVDLSGKYILETCGLPESCTNSQLQGSQIQEFFRGCNVFITGATGFMGKMLVEKLLVSCPNIENLYLLIREKKGKTFQERFDELFSDDMFKRLRQLVPNFRSKIKPINGDCTQFHLGISDLDYTFLTQNISVVFHNAATVKFNENLKTAASINVGSVKEVIEFCKQCKVLKSVVHTSSVYAHCNIMNTPIEEEFYPATVDHSKLLKWVKETDIDVINQVTTSLIKPWPNTYAFTKQLAESVVRKEGGGLPMCVFRPGLVMASYKEPVQGWADNFYGPTGMIAGAGTGVLRIVKCDVNHTANLVPVDLAINALIATAWKTAVDFQQNKKEIKIYNYVSATRNPISWREFIHWNRVYGQPYPTIKAVWYESFHHVTSPVLYMLMFFFLHTLPALVADTVLTAIKKEPVFSKMYKKIHRMGKVFDYFVKTEFHFGDNNILELWNQLTEKDQKIYPFNIEDLNWDEYAYGNILGLRVFLLKDGLETLPKAREKWNRLWFMHKAVQACLILILSWTVIEIFNIFI